MISYYYPLKISIRHGATAPIRRSRAAAREMILTIIIFLSAGAAIGSLSASESEAEMSAPVMPAMIFFALAVSFSST